MFEQILYTSLLRLQKPLNPTNLSMPINQNNSVPSVCPLPPASQDDNSQSCLFNIPPEEPKPNNILSTNYNEVKPNNRVS